MVWKLRPLGALEHGSIAAAHWPGLSVARGVFLDQDHARVSPVLAGRLFTTATGDALRFLLENRGLAFGGFSACSEPRVHADFEVLAP